MKKKQVKQVAKAANITSNRLSPNTDNIPQQQPIDGAFSNMSERIMRIQRDLLLPAIIFEEQNIQNTITVFGSARIKPEKDANALLKAAKAAYAKSASAKNKKALQAAKNAVEMSHYYTCTEELCSKIQQWVNCLKLPESEKFHIISGGGPGIMEAANKGACKSGGKTAGLTISIPDEQRRNDYISDDLWINFNYFLTRKFWLLFFSKAIIVFPGGTGTLDEFFEVYTLIKTQKTPFYMPIILFGKKFWNKLIDFNYLVQTDVVGEKDLELFKLVDTVDEAFEYVKEGISKYISAKLGRNVE